MPNIDVNKIRDIISNNTSINSIDSENLLSILEESISYVNEAFEVEDTDNIINSVSKENFFKYGFNLINNDFDILDKSISTIRSPYLPQEIVSKVLLDGSESVSNSISGKISLLESRHNAFIRMLGLPSLEDVLFENESAQIPKINSNGKIVFLDANSAYRVLDERQNLSSRPCFNPEVFNITEDNEDDDDSAIKILSGYGFSSDIIGSILEFSILLKAYSTGSDDDVVTNLQSYINKEDGTSGKYSINKNDNSNLFFWKDKIENLEDPSDDNLIPIYRNYLDYMYSKYIDIEYSIIDDIDKSNLYGQLVMTINDRIKIDNLEKSFFNFSHLIFPIVKDDRISKCINNSDKIVAEPFLPITRRNVNGNFLRSSLIESIIRIRTDVISGTKSFASQTPYVIGDQIETSIQQDSVSGELLGYLESLLIVRMFESIQSIAKYTTNNIEQIAETQRRTKTYFLEKCKPSEGTNSKETTAAAIGKKKTDKSEIDVLRNNLLLEDSIMLLLGTKDSDEDSLNLQVDINRNSSIPNSHLMSSLVNIVQVPRKYINKRIEEDIRSSKDEGSSGSRPITDIEKSIGIVGGVGYIDFVIITTALLTIDEVSLISLLTKSQIDNMLKQINPDTFDEDKIRQIKSTTIESSLTVLTERINTLYQIFLSFL